MDVLQIGGGSLSDRYSIHDSQGVYLGSVEPAVATDANGWHLDLQFASFSGSGQRLVVDSGVPLPEVFIEEYVQLHSLDGTLLAAVDLGGITASVDAAASDDAIFVGIGDRLTRYGLDAVAEWEIQFESAVTRHAVSPDGSRLAVGLSNGWLVHVADGRVEQRCDLGSTFVSLQFSPSGVFSVAANVNPTRLTPFDLGELLTTLLPPRHYVHALDASDEGDVAAGGVDEAHVAHVLLYAPDGSLRWDCRGPNDVAHVAVHFTDGGRAVFASFRDYYFYLLL